MSPQFTRDNLLAADVLKAARDRLKSERGLTLMRSIAGHGAVTSIAVDAAYRALTWRRDKPVTTWDRIAATCRAERKLRGMG